MHQSMDPIFKAIFSIFASPKDSPLNFFQKFCRLSDLSARIQVSRIASSMEGRHFLALSGQGEVYSWGSNVHGCLGNDPVSER